MSEKNTGRVTIPTNLDVVPETIELMKRWGADAIRDCDGTEFPEELTKTGAKIYATYYTTRKDNEWAKANPDEVQQCYIMSGFYTAVESELQIPLMKGISDELMQVNTRDDIKRWWEVIDRSTGQVVSTAQWEYNGESGCVCIHEAEPFHEYTVSFLAYIIWDPVHMYNAVRPHRPYRSMSIPSVFWLTSSGTRCICTTLPPMAGRILSTRLPLTCVSPRPTSIPWSVCASSAQSIHMSMSSAIRRFSTSLH